MTVSRGTYRGEWLVGFMLLLFIVNAAVFSQNSNNISDKHKSISEIVDSLLNSCWSNRSNSPRKALNDGIQALKLIESNNIIDKKSTALNFIGVVYRNLGILDSAYYFYKSAYLISVTNKDHLQTAYSLTNLGEYYVKNALYPTALEKLLRAQKIFESQKNNRGLAYVLNYIGEIYTATQDYTKANDYFRQAIELRKKSKNKRDYARSLLNLADLKIKIGSLKEAKSLIKEALRISKKINYKKGESIAQSLLSEIFLQSNQIDSSLIYQNKSLKINISSENKYSEIQNYIALGLIYLKLGNTKEAKRYLWKAEEEARNTKHYALLLNTIKSLIDVSVQEKHYEAAYLYQKKFFDLNDRLFGEETRTKIADLQTAFAIERKERENERLKQEVKFEIITRNYLIITFIFLIIAIFASVSRYRTEKKHNKLLKESNDNKDKFLAIIGHDLKNPCGAILNYAQMLESDYDELTNEEKKEIISNIISASVKTQTLLNDLLTWATTQKGQIALNKSRINLEDFMNQIIQSFEPFSKQKGIEIICEKLSTKFIYADKYILQTIISNLINNAIKFSQPKSKILLRVDAGDKKISFSVIDSGIGIEKPLLENLFKLGEKITRPGTNNEKGTGLGLKICKQLAEVHKGEITAQSELGKGSTFTFTLPLEKIS